MRRRIVLTLHIWQEDGVWLGECVELGTIAITDENTQDVLLEALAEQVVLTVKALDAAGNLEQTLAESGVRVEWEEEPAQWKPLLSRTVEAKPKSQVGTLEWFWPEGASAIPSLPAVV